mmetsp:Transcript_66611/g.106809  ORF Transcript_66611/g.106809 Transcript_66611/m.106809 type:complete len:212 (+) Transcript_66611:188-823(+)
MMTPCLAISSAPRTSILRHVGTKFICLGECRIVPPGARALGLEMVIVTVLVTTRIVTGMEGTASGRRPVQVIRTDPMADTGDHMDPMARMAARIMVAATAGVTDTAAATKTPAISRARIPGWEISSATTRATRKSVATTWGIAGQTACAKVCIPSTPPQTSLSTRCLSLWSRSTSTSRTSSPSGPTSRAGHTKTPTSSAPLSSHNPRKSSS